MRILVTGGAGYIGSHVVLHLTNDGHEVVVYDNLSTGHASAVLGGKLVIGDIGDRDTVQKLFGNRAFDVVVHLAAHIDVPESVSNPLKYYRNNTANTLTLLEMASRFRVPLFIFSSTAAVYGTPDQVPVSEDTPLNPISPYGASKAMSERMIVDLASANSMRYVILRYFNVAGADPAGRIGQATPDASHLIKLACQAALRARPDLTIFGTDYPTPDGTCIRDFIHVSDLAGAHVGALDYLADGGESATMNVGYGQGHSVREVIESAQRVSGVDFAVRDGPRRAGDPVELVADNGLIKRRLNWRPSHADLDFIIQTALDWERKRDI